MRQAFSALSALAMESVGSTSARAGREFLLMAVR